jgi:LysM repeat protein
MSLTLMGWPGHYIDSSYSTGSLADTFANPNFSSNFGNNLNIMMYEDSHHQCLDDPTYKGGYVQDYIDFAKYYNIPLTNVHIGFTNFDKVNAEPDQSFYPGSSPADGCNAADTYVRVLKDLGYAPSDFGSTFWWPNEQTQEPSGSFINPIPVAINEIYDFNHRVVDPSWNPPAPTPSIQPLAVSTMQYIVQSGDSLFAIAAQFNATVAQLVSWNPGIDPSNLQIGEGIFVRAGDAYMVQAGDTLTTLANFFNTTVSQLYTQNPHLDPQGDLDIGEVIALPLGVAYEVQSGDSFYKISQIMGISVDALQAANPGITILQPGQVLALPPAFYKERLAA